MLIPLAYKYNILENIIDEVRYGFLLIYASTTYSVVFLLHTPTPAPAPIKIGFSAIRCGSCGCVGEAYTLFRRCDQNWGSPYNESKENRITFHRLYIIVCYTYILIVYASDVILYLYVNNM